MSNLTKLDIQKQLASLQKQVTDLTSIRDEKKSKRSDLLESFAQRKKTMGADELAGKDTGPALDSLVRDQAKLETLEEAITQADAKIRELEQGIKDNQNGLVMLEFNALADVATNQTRSAVILLRDLVQLIDEIGAKYAELEKLSPWAFAQDGIKPFIATWKTLPYEAIKQSLNNLERVAPAIHAHEQAAKR